MKSKRIWAVLFAVVLAVAACGGGDDASDPAPAGSDQATETESGDDGGDDANGAETDNESGNGESAPSVSGTAFPQGADEDFLVPVPAGWEIDLYEELAEQGVTLSGGVQVLYPNDDFDRIVAFYDDWTSQDSADHVRSEAGDTIVYQRMEEPISSITVTKNHEDRDDLFTFLVITVLEDAN